MYGSIVKALDFLDNESSRNQIIEMLSYRYPQLVDANLEAFDKGLEQSISTDVNPASTDLKISHINLGYDNQISGGIIKGANTMLVDRSMSREGFLPTFDQEKCINCTKCDSSCPDDCFVWEEKEGRKGRTEMVLQGIDYQFCKGCLRCVIACPTDALKKEVETRSMTDAITKKKVFDFIN
jgi:pyruvate ferredoxin oxidoreductase gamma subunit